MITFDLTLKLEAPYATRASIPRGFGIDLPLFRNSNDELAIPGTLLEGKLLEAFKHLKDLGLLGYLEDLNDTFQTGSAATGAGDSTGREGRKRIHASDLVLQGQKSAASRSRIAIDPATGAVLESALQVIEQASAPHEELEFKGRLRAYWFASDQKNFQKRLEFALNWMTQIGSLRTVGFGKIISIGAVAADPKKNQTGRRHSIQGRVAF